ncbi:MAG: hypothetical protein Q9187_004383 [Circinaria calcarea]
MAQVHHEFPIPRIPLPEPLPPSLKEEESGTTQGEQNSSQDQDHDPQKENAPPSSLPAVPPTSPPGNTASPDVYPLVPDSQPSSISAPPGTLPSQLLSLFSSIQSTLQTSFSTAPPHTIQRLAELIIRPSDHYRTLPSYLRAIDRVISVSSTADIYPLSVVAPGSSENGDVTANSYLTTGNAAPNRDDFNGAALTRIPWLRDPTSVLASTERPLTSDLRTESKSLIDGPNGAGSLETVTVSINGMSNVARESNGSKTGSGVTIGASDQTQHGRVTRSSTAMTRKEEADEERIHARGPDEIGMEDMGPQSATRGSGGFDVEAAIGRVGESEGMTPTPITEDTGEKDAEGDITIADADGELEVEAGRIASDST